MGQAKGRPAVSSQQAAVKQGALGSAQSTVNSHQASGSANSNQSSVIRHQSAAGSVPQEGKLWYLSVVQAFLHPHSCYNIKKNMIMIMHIH